MDNAQRSSQCHLPDRCDDRQAVVLDASSLTGGRFPKLQIGVFGGGVGWFERLSNFEYLSTFDSESFELELKLRTQWEIRFRLIAPCAHLHDKDCRLIIHSRSLYYGEPRAGAPAAFARDVTVPRAMTDKRYLIEDRRQRSGRDIFNWIFTRSQFKSNSIHIHIQPRAERGFTTRD